MRMAEKSLLLQFLDHIWKDHLLQLDHLRQGINLRAYAQRDPLNEYKREAFELFEAMLVDLREQVTGALSHLEMRMDAPPEPAPLPFGELSYSEEFPPEPEAVMAEADPPPGDCPANGEEAALAGGRAAGRAAAAAVGCARARGGRTRRGRPGPERAATHPAHAARAANTNTATAASEVGGWRFGVTEAPTKPGLNCRTDRSGRKLEEAHHLAVA